MQWLMRAYFNRFLFWLLVIAVVFPTSLIASWAGRHIAKYFDIDDQLVIGGFFFAALAAGVYGYDRFNRWLYFKARSHE